MVEIGIGCLHDREFITPMRILALAFPPDLGGEELIASVSGATPEQIAQQCDGLGEAMKAEVDAVALSSAPEVLAKELGTLLRDGKEEMARIRVEHLIRATNEIHGMEIVELFCDLLLARHAFLRAFD